MLQPRAYGGLFTRPLQQDGNTVSNKFDWTKLLWVNVTATRYQRRATGRNCARRYESTPGSCLLGFGGGRHGRWGLIKTATAKDPLTEEALVARLDRMRVE